jgi:RNA recognition motif-containing protein
MPPPSSEFLSISGNGIYGIQNQFNDMSTIVDDIGDDQNDLTIPEIADCNLYIKNIDYDISDEHLYKVFASLGEITNHHIVRDSNLRSRGFGFL